MYAKPGIISIVLEAGAHGFVEKSAPESVLINAVKSILAGETFVQQNLVSPLIIYKKMFDGFTKQNIIPRSVDNYCTHIFEKTGCRNVHEVITKYGE